MARSTGWLAGRRLVGLLVGRSVFVKGEKLHFYVPIGALFTGCPIIISQSAVITLMS